MHPKDSIIQLLKRAIPLDSQGVSIDIEFYTREEGVGYQGDFVNSNGEFIRYMELPDSENHKWNFADFIRAWHYELASIGDRWNKANFIVYQDGRCEERHWWDQAFQFELYINGE